MNLIVQLQGVGYSFVFGLIFTFCYHLISFYLFKIKYRIIRCSLQAVSGFVFAGCYYFGLLMINDGIVRLYFLVFIMMGYIVYQNLFSHFCFVLIVKITQIVKMVLLPLRIVFCTINGIIIHTKKVIRWQKAKSEKPSNQ